MKTTQDRTSNAEASLEKLVDELIKDSPEESRVRECMLAAGLTYSTDPIERMSVVLSAIETARQKGSQRDQSI